ncbi:glycerophosphodiester phosphodiesterase [Metabacillus sp. KIGAM252]|uniref:Glycerophosphodiester phosphodiesterase n=1 Tax=Metabacillus flavus TaxID=2823519 RepID=A0ABS5LIM5_9BACI|nr:glycerophosphodiester phosphodiesterase [Metabacillus flavus]MBS2970590.1 glycerophosphodiester phosphodiesterase [Metabacillus flavus]
MKIFAHRGCSGQYPENTMLAFRKAIEVGASGIELDVQMSKDGELVVIHDERIDRTTDRLGYVKDMTYKELRNADAGSWFHPSFHNERIPHLEEVLDLLLEDQSGMTLNIELKNDVFDYPGLEEKVMLLAEDKKLASRIILSSFNKASVSKMKQLNKTFEIAWLFEGVEPNAAAIAEELGCDSIHCPAEFSLSAPGLDYMNNGGTLRVYTINDLGSYQSLIHTKVSAVMTDFPDLLLGRIED